ISAANGRRAALPAAGRAERRDTYAAESATNRGALPALCEQFAQRLPASRRQLPGDASQRVAKRLGAGGAIAPRRESTNDFRNNDVSRSLLPGAGSRDNRRTAKRAGREHEWRSKL